ncbi:retention module-containing protein [Shewanella sedimentimangrovi]|uniref:Retention module-containing protein n=1 Tax=Shewanella sedimentimangrovi TaxID=2814293 RepID=A0ABX7QZR2_9GAMM|nr:retention module-containing protein [Shewanella sedimentimangrovi]QSX36939.1 retention module-containing protein [Shewanella sedimentimangrovi]
MGIAINQQDAVVTQIVGQLRAKDEQGNVRTLNIGDIIHQGEQLIFASDDKFVIEYADGTRMSEVNMQSQAQTTPASTQMPDLPADATDAEIAALQAQILAGQDPTADLPETAAGAGGGGTEGGFDYTSVGRDGAETLASAGWDTTGFTTTTLTAQEEPLLTDILPEAPFLANANLTFSDAALPLGSTPDAQQVTQDGTLAFSATSGVLSISIDGVAIVTDGIFNGPVTISTSYGVLTISGVDLANGIMSFSFTQTAAVDHSQGDIFNQLFSLLLTDNLGVTTSSTLTISVGDDAPSGQNDNNSLSEDTSLAVIGNLLANDTQGADTAQVTAAGAGSATNISVGQASQINGSFGVLTLNSDGSYSYQLNTGLQAVQALAQGQTLNEVFSYVLQDADGDISVQTLTITITGSNDAPVITTEQGQDLGTVIEAGNFDDGSFYPGVPSVSGNLSASDVDNGAVLTWSGNADSPFGSFSIDAATGAWTYILDNSAADSLQEGEVRIETFLVTVTDEFGATATQEVTITIVGSNDAPILSAETSGSVTEDQNVSAGMLVDSGALSFTDVDLGDEHQMSSIYNGDISWSGGSLTQDQINALLAGFSVDSNSWDYSIANSLVQFLSVGETITLSFTVTVTDEFGASDSQVVTLTIHGTNDGPVINPPEEGDADGTVIEAGNFDDGNINPGSPEISGTLTATDADHDAVLTWSGNAEGEFGDFVIDPETGTWTFTIDNSAADSLQEGETRTETFLVTVTDQNGATSTQEVTITIVGSNDAPILTLDNGGSVMEDVDVIAGMLSDSGALSFTDVDVGDSHEISTSYNGDASWSGGALTLAEINALAAGFSADNDGWEFSIANSLVQFLADGETITLSFTVTVTDEFGASDNQQVNITITGTNDAPTISDIADFGFVEALDASNQSLLANGTVNFDDVDTNDLVSVATSLQSGAVWSGGVLDAGLKAALEAGFSASVTNAAAPGSTGWTFDASNLDLDFLGEGETITLTFRVTVSDGHGGSAYDDVTITITGTNDAPTISDIADFGFVEALDASNQSLLANGTVNFDDVDTNDLVSVATSLQSGAVWSGGVLDAGLKAALEAGFSASVTNAAAPGSTGWTFDASNLDLDFLGEGETITLTFRVTVSDGHGGSAYDDVTITITGTNDAPTISDIADFGFVEALDASNQSLLASGTVSFDDVDTNDLVSVATSLQSGAVWSGGVLDAGLKAALEAGFSASATNVAAPGSTGWTFDASNLNLDFLAQGETITLTFRVTVSDGHGGSAYDDVTITITGTNDAPTISDIADFGFVEALDASNQSLLASGTVSFDDVDTNDLVSVATSLQSGAVWSGGVLDAGLKAALEAGFSASVTNAAAPGSTGWTFDASNLDLDFLGEGETITLTFRVTVSDGHGGSAYDDVTITITGTNDAPTISDIADFGFVEALDASNQSLLASGTVSFDDVDTNDLVSVATSLQSGAVWSGGVLDAGLKAALEAGFSASATNVAAPGSTGWTFDASNLNLDFLAQGETITLTFRVTVSDGHGGSAYDDVTITITGTNDAPTISDIADFGFVEALDASNQSLLASGTVSFDDVDTNDLVSVATSLQSGAVWSGGVLDAGLKAALEAGFSASATNVAAPGSTGWTFDASNLNLDFLAQGETITLTFRVTVSDGHGGSAYDDVTITITGTNDAPTISDIADFGFVEALDASNQSLLANGTVSFDDVDTNDLVSVATSLQSGAVWSGGVLDAGLKAALEAGFSASATNVAAPGSTGWTFDASNLNLDFLAQGETITLTFRVTVSDGHGGSAYDDVTITITGTNDAPTISDIADFGFVEALDASNQSLLANGTVSFDDVDTNDLVSVATSLQSGAVWSGGVLDAGLKAALEAGFSASATNVAAPGSTGWTFDASNLNLDFLGEGETITLTFRVTVSDGHGGSAYDDVTITITGTNDAPTISDIADFGFVEALDASNQSLLASGTVSFDDVDTNDLVSVATSLQSGAVWSGGVLDAGLKAALEAGFSASATNVAAPGSTGWTFDASNLNLDFLGEGETITLTFRVTVSDGHGGSAYDDVTITITGTNDAPTISDIADFGFVEALDASNQSLLASGTVSFDDVDTNDLVSVATSLQSGAVWSGGVLDAGLKAALEAGFSASATNVAAPGSTGWTFDASNLNLDFLAQGETITLTFRVTVSDGHGGSAYDDVTITITGTNDAPTISDIADFGFVEALDASNQSLLASGTVSFDDVDTNDLVSVATSLQSGAVWSGGVLDAGLKAALEAGFSASVTNAAAPGSTGWTFDASNLDLDFLGEGETITLTFRVTVSDGHGGSAYDDVTITITGTNDAVEGEFAKEIWVPASMAELLNPYDDGYPLHIAVPTDTDTNDVISITNISMAFVDQNVVADIGTLWYVPDGAVDLVPYDFDNPVNLSATELGTLVYMPGDNGDLDSQLDISLTFTINSGTEQVLGDFVIHTVPQNSLGDNSVLIGDGSSPLTSGNDQDAFLTVSSGFAEVLNTDPSLGTLDLFTDFQKSPFDIPIPGDEIGGTTGQEREDEVSVRLTINGITFIVIAAANGVTDWTFDVDSGLMKASVAYDSILMESDLSTTLAQYLAANPVSAGDIWTITYLDNDGGSYQARFVQATFTHELLPDTAITVTGTDNVDNLIFGTTEGDILTGANLNDEIVGREGNDIIKGLTGDDELLGGSGNDTIEGGTGADYLIGGLGSDSLDAGIDTDRDILVWDTGSADGSTDDVYHFDPDHDALDLSDILLNEENGSLEDYFSFSFGGGDTTITIDSNGADPGGDTVTIVLHGTDLSAIYGSANETDIIQGLLGDNALLVTEPPAPPILPEPNHVVIRDEHSIP